MSRLAVYSGLEIAGALSRKLLSLGTIVPTDVADLCHGSSVLVPEVAVAIMRLSSWILIVGLMAFAPAMSIAPAADRVFRSVDRGGRLESIRNRTTSASTTTKAERISRTATVSDDFYQKLLTASGTIPEPVWIKVEAAGWRVQLAEFVVEIVPGLTNTQPRGWPEETTWANTDAVHLPGSRLLVLAEKRRNKRGEVVACGRVEGVLRHEMGHAFDMVAGADAQFVSASPEFLAAYLADIQTLVEEQKTELAYYLQDQDAGRQEAFAEAFGIVLGGGSDTRNQQAFSHSFPNVLKFVNQLIRPGQ